MNTLKVGSLFAGVGGICSGFLQASEENEYKYTIAWANEIDKYACETYRHNFSHMLIEGDIEKILAPELASDNFVDYKYYSKMRETILSQKIDVLNGGFPCQAFSVAGERKGFADERGNLFFSIVELIKQLGEYQEKPRFLLLENVKNLQNHNNGHTYEVIKKCLEQQGYMIVEAVLNTMDLTSLPQNRERLYILGFLNQIDYECFTLFDKLEKYKIHKTHCERKLDIQTIISNDVVDEKYFYTEEKYPNYFNGNINLANEIDEQLQFYQLRRVYVRKNKNNVCPTLTANMGTGGHNVPLILTKGGIRKITPAEAFRLQGFNVGDGYQLPVISDCHLYKQAGNAVSVPVVKLLAEELLRIVKATENIKDRSALCANNIIDIAV